MLTKGSRVDVQRASDISKRWREQAREPAELIIDRVKGGRNTVEGVSTKEKRGLACRN